MARGWRFSASLVLLVVLWSSSVFAQRTPMTPQEREARQLFQQGVEMTRFERWGEALEFFRRSRALVDRPSTTLNIGYSMLRLGQVLEAEEIFTQLLGLPPGQLETARRTEAEQYLEQARTARATLQLQVEPANARVEIDGAAREGTGAARTIPLNPGTHRLRIFAEEHRDETLEVSALPGNRLERSVRLTATPVITRIVVDSPQSQSVVHLDGALLEQSERNVAPGEHLIEVTAPGFRPFRRSVTVPRGQTVTVTADLVRNASIASNPYFWLGLGGGIAVAAVGVGLIVAFAGPEVANGGSTNQVFYTITAPF